MPADGGITSITEPIEIEIVEDRVHFTCVSGKRRSTYAVSFHKARNACQMVLAMLEKHERERASAITPFVHKAAKERLAAPHD